MNQFWKWAAVAAALGTFTFAQNVKSKKEGEAVMAIQNATTADDRLAAIEALLTKFADTEFKVLVLEIGLDTTQSKNDPIQTTIYAERVLEADPKNLNAIATLAKVTSSQIKENDLDKEDRLKRVDELTGQCLKIGPDTKNPNKMLNDEQWAKRKKEYLADCHDSVAIAALVRKKPEVSLTEFQASLELRNDPATMVRIGQVYNNMGKYDEAIAILDKAQETPDVNPIVKQVASQEKVKAIMARNKAKAATPAPPKPQ